MAYEIETKHIPLILEALNALHFEVFTKALRAAGDAGIVYAGSQELANLNELISELDSVKVLL